MSGPQRVCFTLRVRWQAEMAEFFDLEGADAPDRAMAPLPEIFHLD
jgi:L-rhamnose mutarotase